MKDDVWFVPVAYDAVVISAPFHGITTLVNPSMAEAAVRCLEDDAEPIPDGAEWIAELRRPASRPERHYGAPDPLFLGLVPTRGCMMACAYCDFVTLNAQPLMSFRQIREAVDAYAELLRGRENAEWNMHFFGGEPFAAFKEVVFAVNYARLKAEKLGIGTHFEVTTNGFYTEERCRWIAANFDTVVLSLDGPPKVQDRHRPARGGKGSFDQVCRSADIFSRGNCEFIIRSCVSAENVGELAEWALFLSQRWTPEAVCLEPMIESGPAERNGLIPPDADLYIRNWTLARLVLDNRHIRLVCSSGDISETRNSLCPMGRDALIVDPEGRVGSCWQLSENQLAGAGDLHFGRIENGALRIDPDRLEKQRALSEEKREACCGCFCYAYCAGGCVLNRERSADFCRITKVLTLWQLLDRLGHAPLGDCAVSTKAYLDWLTACADFRCGKVSFEDIPPTLLEHFYFRSEPEPAREGFGAVLPALPQDADRGWLREGSRIFKADLPEGILQILEGEDALRFQLEHSGLDRSDIETVWDELHREAA